MFEISTKDLIVKITETGAEITSIQDKNGKEYIWCGDKKVWGHSAPVLFPICGGLKDDGFIYDGKKYALRKHGFCIDTVFECEKHTANELILLYKSNNITKETYPFDFEFRVRFTVSGESLFVSYITKNTGDNDMYYSVGCHEAMALDDTLETYDIVFDKEEKLYRTVIDGTLLGLDTEKVETDGKVLHMQNSHMDNDSLVFKKIKSKGVNLVNRNTGKGVRVDFDGFESVVIWTMAGEKFLCIEPWNGLPDSVDSDMMIEHKEGIQKLNAGEEQIFVHKITPIK